MTRRVSLWALAATPASISLAGCSFSPADAPRAAPDSKSAGRVSHSIKNDSKPQNGAPSPWKVWTQALSRYAQGLEPASKTALIPRKSIGATQQTAWNKDVLSLARDHPAWRLADALERRQFAPGDTTSFLSPNRNVEIWNGFANVGSGSTWFTSEAFRGLNGVSSDGVPNFDFASGARTRNERRANSADFGVANPLLASVALSSQRQAARLPQWEQTAREQQESAFADFLQTVAAQQLALRRAREDDLGAALADDVEAARQVRWSPLDPLLPSDPVQLEMTNLRLRLLENARLTPLEKRRARTRLAILEARWRQKLQSGQQADRNEFLSQRDAVPLQARNEGEARIVAALAQMRAEDSARYNAAQVALRQRLQADFDSQPALAIASPAVSPQIFRDNGGKTSSGGIARNELRKTFVVAPPSKARVTANTSMAMRELNFPTRLPPFQNGNSAAPASVFDSNRGRIEAQIQALRRRALLESARWARLAARSTKSQ